MATIEKVLALGVDMTLTVAHSMLKMEWVFSWH